MRGSREPLGGESLRLEMEGGTVSPSLNDPNSAADDAETRRDRWSSKNHFTCPKKSLRLPKRFRVSSPFSPLPHFVLFCILFLLLCLFAFFHPPRTRSDSLPGARLRLLPSCRGSGICIQGRFRPRCCFWHPQQPGFIQRGLTLAECAVANRIERG